MYLKPLTLIVLLSSANALALPDDQYQPIEIHADSAIRQEKEGLTTYKGNVFMKQGSLQVEAESITVSNVSNQGATSLIAIGNPAKFQQQPDADKDIVYASAESINYDLDAGRIELSGEAKLTQGEAKITSDNIVYLSDEQVFKAEKANGGGEREPQRVQVIIPAKKKQNDEETAP